MDIDDADIITRVEHISLKIKNASKILVIASRPVDYDCLGTSLLIKWYLSEVENKEVKAYIFTEIPDHIKHFPDIQQIEQKYLSDVDFNYYDLIILPDGNEFRQFLTNDYKKILSSVDNEKFISIDHHPPGKIEDEIPESTLRIIDSCTAKVFFDYFISSKDLIIPKHVAEYMYMALIGDTGSFSHAIYSHTFSFAQKLLDLGADHYKATSLSIPKNMMDLTAWAIENTEYFPEAKSTILKIDAVKKDFLKNTFGEDWESMSLLRYYMNIFMRMVEDFPYSIVMITTNDEKSIKIIYRVKNYQADINLQEALSTFGFDLKGHPKAGSGLVNNESMDEALNKYLDAMKGILLK